MTQPNNPLELYKHLAKTNCGQCLLPSCMAFSVAVIKGNKKLADCPFVDRETLVLLGGEEQSGQNPMEQESEEALKELRQKISEIDLKKAAGRLNASFEDGRLAVRCLVRDFLVDPGGNVTSECHINSWVQVPLLQYIILGKGSPPSGDWVPFGELKGGPEWKKFFAHRCEESLRLLADAHDELFFDLLQVFGGRLLTGETSADYAIVLHPLPRVPFLINYWRPEDGLDSKLNVLFDRSAQDNLNIESIYLLGRGMVEMFRRLIPKHSKEGRLF